MKFIKVLIVGLFLALLPTQAFADHNGPTLPGIPTIVMNRVMQQGYVTYSFDTGAGNYPGFRDQAREVAQAGDLALGIPAQETVGRPDIWLMMPDDATFVSICGSGAAGCILYWSDPIIIYFRRALLLDDWKTAIAHEGINFGHAMGQHEQYYDRTFTCKSVVDLIFYGPGLTVMSCGTYLWQPQPFDISVVRNTMMPSRFDGGALAGNWAWYGGSDAKTTRIAVFFETYAGYLYFTGTYLQPMRGCSSIVCGGAVIPDPGICQGVWLGHENALPGSWLRGLQLVGWSNCFPD